MTCRCHEKNVAVSRGSRKPYDVVSLADGVLVNGAVGQSLGGGGGASIAHLEEVLGRGAGDGLVGGSLLNCPWVSNSLIRYMVEHMSHDTARCDLGNVPC